jgi:hypothetical protein
MHSQSDSCDDEFLLSRILFLMTYGSDANFEKLINENGLGESINQVRGPKHKTKYLELTVNPVFSKTRKTLRQRWTASVSSLVPHGQHGPD